VANALPVTPLAPPEPNLIDAAAGPAHAIEAGKMAYDLDAVLGPNAGTAFGSLNPGTRHNLRAVLDCPCEHHWDEAAHCVVNAKGQTLWQAVMAVDPSFPATGPSSRRNPKTGRSVRISGWSKTPDEKTLLAALRQATG
jgi:hypothetical protein